MLLKNVVICISISLFYVKFQNSIQTQKLFRPIFRKNSSFLRFYDDFKIKTYRELQENLGGQLNIISQKIASKSEKNLNVELKSAENGLM